MVNHGTKFKKAKEDYDKQKAALNKKSKEINI